MRSCVARASARAASAACCSDAAAVDALIGRQRGRARASRMGGKVASVEHDQHLTRAHAIAGRHADLADRRQNARHDRGRRPRLDHAARLERVGDVGHGHRRDRDGNRALPRRRAVVFVRLEQAGRTRPQERSGDAARDDVMSSRHHVVIAFPGFVRSAAVSVSTATCAAVCCVSACSHGFGRAQQRRHVGQAGLIAVADDAPALARLLHGGAADRFAGTGGVEPSDGDVHVEARGGLRLLAFRARVASPARALRRAAPCPRIHGTR